MIIYVSFMVMYHYYEETGLWCVVQNMSIISSMSLQNNLKNIKLRNWEFSIYMTLNGGAPNNFNNHGNHFDDTFF